MNKPRLIDANEPIEIIGNMIKPLITPDGATSYDPDIQAYDEGLVAALETIDECPTAYDVDKVVEQLERYANEEIYLWAHDEIDYDEEDKLIVCKKTDLHKYAAECFWKAIEIVKGGAE